MILAARGITKKYGTRQVLTDCSFEVRGGECVLLRGPSGAGKSTLLRILALLEAADEGAVVHGDTTWPANTVQRSSYPFLTVVFQQLFLWPNLTMAQNVALALYHRINHALPPKALDTLDRFGVLETLPRLPHECSLGERQRLAIARALLCDAQFLLLDEPSSALDTANRELLAAELGACAVNGRGLLIVTHQDPSFSEIATRTLVLEHSRLTLDERAG